METGKMIIVSAPSGAGKTTIVRAVLEEFPQLKFSISACSRPKRKHEIEGKDYYFITAEKFKAKIDNNEFLEWEEVYPGSYYGTLKSELKRIWSKGKHVIFDVDVKGGVNIKKQYPQHALAIFIKPPDFETLRDRLKKRGTEDNNSLENRLKKAAYEMTFEPQFDVTVVNDNIDEAINETKTLIANFLNN